jgi:hypothetical protein
MYLAKWISGLVIFGILLTLFALSCFGKCEFSKKEATWFFFIAAALMFDFSPGAVVGVIGRLLSGGL